MSRGRPAGSFVLKQKAGEKQRTERNTMKAELQLNVEELEARIAPDSVNGVPGESNGNPGNEVSNGNEPQPGSNTRDSHGN
jgi:hypothetical protein